MQNNPFLSSREKGTPEPSQKKITKKELQDMLSAMEARYKELVAIDAKIKSLNKPSDFSIERTTNDIQKATDKIDALTDNASQEALWDIYRTVVRIPECIDLDIIIGKRTFTKLSNG